MPVPKGYRAIWGYKGKWDETKVRKGLWRFKFSAVKHRNSKSFGDYGVGTKGGWDIKGKQYITKIKLGTYRTTFIGTKKPLRFDVIRVKRK